MNSNLKEELKNVSKSYLYREIRRNAKEIRKTIKIVEKIKSNNFWLEYDYVSLGIMYDYHDAFIKELENRKQSNASLEVIQSYWNTRYKLIKLIRLKEENKAS